MMPQASRLVLDRGGHAPTIRERGPRRLQRPRTRGLPMPDGAVYVGRPTDFANPFDWKRFGHARSVRLFNRWIAGRLGDLTLEMLGFCPAEIDALARLRRRVIDSLPKLAGKDLQCWCPSTSRWCHADTLLTLANNTGAVS